MGIHRSRLTDFSQKIAFSNDNLVIFRPMLMKLEMWADINPNLSLLKCRYAWVTIRVHQKNTFSSNLAVHLVCYGPSEWKFKTKIFFRKFSNLRSPRPNVY